ncbi:YczE/YyaS/YitT family protein [Microbacterium sp. DT81.1]|uniref:membrane protein YczE n=1 Tax=Microbacterium sp. DT81.1 TaxID=3393413 RepID=UPI003CF72A3F
MTRRVLQLLIGLVLYGAGCALTVEAGLGVDPWTVFAQGVSVHTGIGIGWVTNIIGFGVLLLWIPLRQKPGIGTIANILIVGTSMQATLSLVSAPSGLFPQVLVFVAGLLMVAVASGLYIGARFGPGPRDGLMTGIKARLGWPIWLARGTVEITVLAIGWVLGGTVGVGTMAFAFLIGPLVHVALPLLDTGARASAAREDDIRDTVGSGGATAAAGGGELSAPGTRARQSRA